MGTSHDMLFPLPLLDTRVIWERFHANMRQYLRKRVKNQHDVEDLLQEIFMKIHLNVNTLQKQDHLHAWIWQLTRNTLIDYYKKRRQPGVDLDEASAITQEAENNDYNELLAHCIRPYMDLLPPDQREAILLADIERIPQKELAKRWGISYSGAKSRVQRARIELYNQFQCCCRVESDRYGNIIKVGCWDN